MGVGPLCTVIPKQFHQHFSNNILKSYLACDKQYGEQLQRSVFPADIPVIVRNYTNTVYPEVLENLNDLGRLAVQEMHPWVLCTLIDWADFDKAITCSPSKYAASSKGID